MDISFGKRDGRQFNPLWVPPFRLLCSPGTPTPGHCQGPRRFFICIHPAVWPLFPDKFHLRTGRPAVLGAWGWCVKPPHLRLAFSPMTVSEWALPITHWARCPGAHRLTPHPEAHDHGARSAVLGHQHWDWKAG